MLAWRLDGAGGIPCRQPPGKGHTMFSITLKRSAATLGVVAGLLVAAVPAMAAGTAASNAGPPSGGLPNAGATSQGIIMSDGRICDPIRHMGC